MRSSFFDFFEQTWFKHVMQTSAHDSDAVMDVISEVHQLASRLRNRVMNRHRSKFLLELCQTRFVKQHAEQILNFNGKSNGRVLMKEGVLVRHTHTGREKKYRFFLFNDLFLYASGGGRSKLKVHNYLPLDTMTVREAPQDNELDASVSFLIESPVKSFAISASTPSKKRSWMEAIEHACRQQEIDRMEEEKISMIKRAHAAADSSTTSTTSTTGTGNNKQHLASTGDLSTYSTKRKGEQGTAAQEGPGHVLGDKRISMLDRFTAAQQDSLAKESAEKRAARRQSTIVNIPQFAVTVVDHESSEKLASRNYSLHESKGEAKMVDYGEDAFVVETDVPDEKVAVVLTDQDIKLKFQKGLKFSKTILEGSHPVRN